MRLYRRVLVASAWLAGILLCDGAGKVVPQWIVVSAPEFRRPLEPLIERRRAEGLRVVVLETTNLLNPEQIRKRDGEPLRAQLQKVSEPDKGPVYVLLVGAALAIEKGKAEQTVVPASTGTIGRMKGQPSDHPYGFPGKDGMPVLAVGRFPAQTTAEVRSMVKKTLELENEKQPATWRSRLVLLAGDPGGGPLADMMLEPTTVQQLGRLNPAWSISAIFNSAASRYYLPGPRAHESFLARMQEGEMFAAFLGHSSAGGMWLQGNYFVTSDDWARLKIAHGGGVFFTCGCYGCQLGGNDGEGYGLTAMRNPLGPVAVIGAIGESYSAAGTLAGDGILSAWGKLPFPVRLADYWLAVQAGLAQGGMDDFTFQIYDQLDGSKGKVPLAVQRLEHLEMWMLLGDPALRLPLEPVDVTLAAGPLRSGQTVSVAGELPKRLAGASVQITLERPLIAKATNLERLPSNAPENRAARDKAAVENNARANDTVLASAQAELRGMRFTGRLPVPANVPWSNVIIRAYATTKTDSGMGVVAVPVGQ